ncbi:MAG: hypothetical protein PUC47_09375, partial [Oscillospiraceae bacterium]|nr:hypothetical protein [Oscillospiraceae bacterium]
MLYENQLVLDQQTHVLRSGREETLTFTLPDEITPQDFRFKLQLKGDVPLHPYMLTETGITRMYQEITDALSTDACTERFSMKLSSKGEDFPRRAFYKLSWPPYEGGRSSAPDSWVLSARIKSEGLAVLPGGFVGLRLEEFRRREGRNPRDIGGEPDSVTLLPFPSGTRDWTEVQVPFAPHDDTVTLVLSIAMEHAEGTVWAEGPWLTGSSGFSVVVPFGMPAPYHPNYCWHGENLSKVERPRLRLTLNGHTMEADLYQRCHVGCENEIVLPDGWLREGVNVLALENITDAMVPMPYELRQTALVYGRKELRIVYAPEHPQADSPFGVLLWLEKPCTVRVHTGEGVTGPDTVTFTEAGLQTLTLQAGAEGRGICLTVEANGETDTAVIRRIVDKVPDGVLTGSGDAVYIAQEPADMKEFFAWYMQNHLGNFITLRPVYRWSGSRSLRPETWQWLRKMCEALQEHYCLLIDGRELPGLNCNPPEALLKGDYYIGNQGHERDGALYYWQQRPQPYDEVFFQELFYRTLQHPDFDYKAPILYDGNKTYIYYNADAPKNMAEAADQLRNRFHQIMHDIHRHTGPSVLFKYFFQAGLEVGGAELMYGPQEVILSALRGASAAYDRPEFAAHLAVQWSTT